MADEKVSNAQGENTFRSVYNDTTYFIDNIINEYDVFPTILDKMSNGDATIELRKSFFLRAIDETWVNVIEDAIPSLDYLIRNPSRYIEDKEEILPVERTKKVSVRTLQHLAQHTDYISRIDGDEIIPKKLLNVYKDETLLTYENKFINTLINRLFAFVNRRYEIAKKSGQDEKNTKLEFKESFDHDDVKVRINFSVEIGENADKEEDRVEQNYSFTTELWRRVERLNRIITGYTCSEFIRSMGHAFIRPPVMRTNAIMKNKDLHACYLLWQFIETYDSAGYSMIVQENLEDIEESYIKELYSTLAIQYLIFRYNIKNEFEADKTLSSGNISDEMRPRIVDELKAVTTEEFNVAVPDDSHTRLSPSEMRYFTLTPEDRLILESIDIALEADAILRSRAPEEEEEEDYEEPAEGEAEPHEDEYDLSSTGFSSLGAEHISAAAGESYEDDPLADDLLNNEPLVAFNFEQYKKEMESAAKKQTVDESTEAADTDAEDQNTEDNADDDNESASSPEVSAEEPGTGNEGAVTQNNNVDDGGKNDESTF